MLRERPCGSFRTARQALRSQHSGRVEGQCAKRPRDEDVALSPDPDLSAAPDSDSSRLVIRDLLAMWPVTTQGISGWRAEARQVAVVAAHGLVAHCHRLAEAVLLLDSGGYRLEVYPLVRAAYEAALTAAWLAHVPDAPEAFVNAEWRNRHILLDGIEPAWGQVVPHAEIDAAAARQPAALYETSSQTSARHFERLCDDLEPAGKQAYGVYRLLCSNTHPSAWVAEHYLRPGSEDDPLRLSNRPDRFEEDASLALQMTGAAVVWSERAMLSLAEEPAAETLARLEAASSALGVAAELTASSMAKNRTTAQQS